MDEKTTVRAGRRATVHDVAQKAGVSLATVDRVLNGRPGVRPETAERVETAILALGFSRDLSASLLARARDLRVQFLLPSGANEFMANLADAVEKSARPAMAERMRVETASLPALDPKALARKLDSLEPRNCDCAVFVAIEDGDVVTAVNSAAKRGVSLVTLVSDLPGSQRHHFVGIDNQAAGRTAASLLGRFCAGGKIGVIMGSLGLRDHRERWESFRSLMADEFPGLEVLDPLEGHEDPSETGRHAEALIAGHGDLAGVYNLGAGNSGLVEAMKKSGKSGTIRVIVHELTAVTQAGLRSGAIDVVLDQNPVGEIRAAIAAARSLALNTGRIVQNSPANETIEIGVFLRDNLR